MFLFFLILGTCLEASYETCSKKKSKRNVIIFLASAMIIGIVIAIAKDNIKSKAKDNITFVQYSQQWLTPKKDAKEESFENLQKKAHIVEIFDPITHNLDHFFSFGKNEDIVFYRKKLDEYKFIECQTIKKTDFLEVIKKFFDERMFAKLYLLLNKYIVNNIEFDCERKLVFIKTWNEGYPVGGDILVDELNKENLLDCFKFESLSGFSPFEFRVFSSFIAFKYVPIYLTFSQDRVISISEQNLKELLIMLFSRNEFKVPVQVINIVTGKFICNIN